MTYPAPGPGPAPAPGPAPGHLNQHVYGVANENQFLCICNDLHVYLSPISFRFVTIYIKICCHLHIYLSLVSFRVMIFLWICHNLCVYLPLVSFIFVPMFIWICEEMQMYMIHICHIIHVVILKAAHNYKLVYQLICIFAQNLCRGLPEGMAYKIM